MPPPVPTNPLIGASPVMREIYDDLDLVSQSKATVLIRGESGTGKELIAQRIHTSSPRKNQPFIKVNCAALSETLIESELFGHEKGAFTGAVQNRKGRFELAHGGTIFLDEVGDLPLAVQVKLLRVIQEMAFERVGGTETLSVDVRVIAATHRNLEKAIIEGKYRQDLYYRLSVIPILIPPLRERTEDIHALILYFLKKFNTENNKTVILSREMADLLQHYHWPGNVRELENCMERLVVLARGGPVTLKNIPNGMSAYFNDIQQVSIKPGRQMKENSLSNSIQQIEKEALKKALERCAWVQAKAGRLLGFTPRQVAYKIKKYKLFPDALT
ncbi:Response regulator of zinc sigma-54-dependent two-component system [hydrothermal vent metagenome]|uniref:Response regulator of zinc sigma-54-dependent two-component system n=1 Tax=hydrothermal vent metagenome TaxID=652676 RepID=A0A3B1CIF0_9ZZZZ